jgi:hypothetical protein
LSCGYRRGGGRVTVGLAVVVVRSAEEAAGWVARWGRREGQLLEERRKERRKQPTVIGN